MKKSNNFSIKNICLVLMFLFLHVRIKEFQAEFYICCTNLNALQNEKKKLEKKVRASIEKNMKIKRKL